MFKKPEIRYETATLRDVQITTTLVANKKGQMKEKASFVVNGVQAADSKRFWTAFNNRFPKFAGATGLFGHQRSFDELLKSGVGGEVIRFAIEDSPTGSTLLGVAPAKNAKLTVDDALQIAAQHGGERPRYSNGIISVDFTPHSGHHPFKIGGDEFKNRVTLDLPIDGYGKPQLALSLLRLICLNGATMLHQYFKTEINTGDGGNAHYTVDKAVSTYDNEKGYDILARRFDSAQKSWASVDEAMQMQDFLIRLGVTNDKMAIFRALCGNILDLYAVANANAITRKKRQQLPTKARVYDLINFATELSTHHLDATKSRAVLGYLGSLLTEEFDLEGTATDVPEFQDLFLKAA